MRLRVRVDVGGGLDGFSEEEMARIRGAAAASVTPGLEGLAPKRVKPNATFLPLGSKRRDLPPYLTPKDEAPKGKRGRRA